jgi:hypothetical protein
MSAKVRRSNSSRLPDSYRRFPPIAASLRRMGAEDEIVRRCSSGSDTLALAYLTAFEALQRYDDELKHLPANAWGFFSSQQERDEICRGYDEYCECADLQFVAAQLVEELSHKATCEELLSGAWAALSYFRVRAR